MIRIITGWSGPGGSTIAHINLCNLFNENGLDCKLYGPHDWHMGRCRSGNYKEFMNSPSGSDDIIISHCCILPENMQCRKHILSCHETSLVDLRKIDLSRVDLIHFVSESQKKWHPIDHPNLVIPNVISDLKKSPMGTHAAGVIGSIDSNKAPHLSVKRALEEAYLKVLLYGAVTDPEYLTDFLEPIIKENPGRVIMKGHVDDQQSIYDSIDAAYHSSQREAFNFIKAECELTGVSYNGLDSCETGAEYTTKSEIWKRWKELLA